MVSKADRLKTTIGDLCMASPVIIASGVWPYDEKMWNSDLLEGVGAVCTKAVTTRPRIGNPGIRLWETPSGMLNSIGLQNTGVESFLRDYLPGLSNVELPFILNVAAESEEDIISTLSSLEQVSDRIPCVELNISCPNVDDGGMLWGKLPEGAEKAVGTARSVWKGPLWVKLTPQAFDIAEIGVAAQEAGADALVASNTWLGMDIDIIRSEPVFQRTFAGLSGPAVFPLALRVVWELCSAVSIPVIGCGGVTSARDCLAMIMAGATAVETGTALLTDLNSPLKICRGIEEFLDSRSFEFLKDIRGIARKRA